MHYWKRDASVAIIGTQEDQADNAHVKTCRRNKHTPHACASTHMFGTRQVEMSYGIDNRTRKKGKSKTAAQRPAKCGLLEYQL